MVNVIKSQLIEQVLPGISGGNTTTKVQLQDQPYLRQKQIMGLEILNSSDMSVSPTGRTPITDAQMQKAYLTLYLNDPLAPQNVGEWIQLVPFSVLHRIQNSTPSPFVRDIYPLANQVIYWEKCYVSLGTAYNNTTDISFLIQVYFKG